MDIDLFGELDGIETAKKMISNGLNAPIIYNTGLKNKFEEAKVTYPRSYMKKDEQHELLIQNVILAIQEAKPRSWTNESSSNSSKSQNILHFKKKGGGATHFHPDEVYALETYENNSNMCRVHLFTKRYKEPQNKILEISIKKMIEILNCSTFIKVNAGLALRFEHPFYRGYDSNGDNCWYVRFDSGFVNLKSKKVILNNGEMKIRVTEHFKRKLSKKFKTLS